MSERYGQPWKVDSERTTVIRDSKQSKVAWVTALGRGQIAAEDAARLIAAAPDMLEALEAAVDTYKYNYGRDLNLDGMAAAIAKARGPA